MLEDSLQKAYNKATARCAMREYCRSDWRTKFMQQGLNTEQTEALIDKLIQEGYINETRYARAFTHDKLLYGRCGRQLVRQQLRAKGIDEADIVESFESVSEEEYTQQLQKVLQQKSTGMRAKNEYEARQKVARYAISRGYEPHLVFELMNEDFE